MNMELLETIARRIVTVSADELALVLKIPPEQLLQLLADWKLPKPVSFEWSMCEISDWLEIGRPDLKTWESIKERNSEDEIKTTNQPS